MRPTTGRETESHWIKRHSIDSYEKLNTDIEADVCIIGAGIAGLTTAYMLCKSGKSVVVLEQNWPGSGQSSRTTAHFTNALDDRYFELEKLHGPEGARLAAESHTAAINKVEEIIKAENIDCKWLRVPGYLICSPTEDKDYIEKELHAAQRAGVPGVELLARAPLQNFDSGPCISFPNQGQLQIVEYLQGLLDAIQKMGGKIFTQTEVDSIEGTSEDLKIITHDRKHVFPKSLVVATNTPVNDLVVIHTKQAAYRTYVITAAIEKGSFPRCLLWDTGDPYHYIRLDEGIECDYLIVGGEDYKTGQDPNPDIHFKALEQWTRQRFKIINVTSRWSGQVQEPMDSLAFLGRNPLDGDNVFVITGDSGNGMTHATIGAMIIRDQIAGVKNAWEDLYKPSRRNLRALNTFFKENLNVAAQYADYISGTEVETAESIPVGEGAIMREGIAMVAVYKDPYGNVQKYSAVCPHLGCVVHWNSTEKSWDCPCHGSRFNQNGEVLTGPAISDLKKLDS